MKKGIIGFVGLVTGVIGGVIVGGKLISGRVETVSPKVDKFKGYYNTLNQWLMLKQQGISLEKYFTDNKYNKIAIYGMGELGNRLYDELKDSSIEVKYAIDQNAMAVYSNIDVVDMDEITDDVDVVVVTAVFAMEKVESELQLKISCPIVSLEDIVYEM
ncbi:MAG: hypothetical protein J6A03_00755 [Lachnospiraceae bacterium]|nr:hypothetical protein [Lachnospiraceae bacterium]